MAGLNKVLLIGNVGGDPEIRDLSSGSKVANFSLATSESYTDRNGQKQTQTEWHRIELWDGLAKIAEQYINKGDALYVEGKIKNERWTDKEGVEKTGVRIRGLSLQLLTPRNQSGDFKPVSSAPVPPTEKTITHAQEANNNLDQEDDLPF